MRFIDEMLLNKAHFLVIGPSYCGSRGIIQKGLLRLEKEPCGICGFKGSVGTGTICLH